MWENNMGYSEEDLESTYESVVGTVDSDVSVWNSHTVYFDDEVVEYQGKYYVALCKTSAEVPGRSKAGIWKELHSSDEQDTMYDSEYGDDSYDEPIVEQSTKPPKKEVFSEKQTQEKKPADLPKKTVAAQVKNTSIKKQPTLPEKVKNRPVNKPLSTKKTLKEQEDENRSKAKLAKAPTSNVMTKNSMKKMEVAPSEQSIVNDILKEMEFKKIKGFNADENSISKKLLLPQERDGVKLLWNSSHPEIISSKGEIKRPEDGHDVAVNLSLTVSINNVSATRFFTLWVKALEKVLSDEECVEDVYEKLSFEHIKGNNIKESSVTEDLNLVTHGLYGTEIFWASKNRDILDEAGYIIKDKLSEETKIRIYAIIVKGSAEKLKAFNLVLKV